MAIEPTPDMGGLTPAQRALLYKQRQFAQGIGKGPSPNTRDDLGGGAAAAPAPAAEAPAPVAAAPAPAPAAAAPATAPAAAAPAAPPKPFEPPKPEPPKDPPFVTRIQETVPGTTWQWRHGYVEIKVPRESLLVAARSLYEDGFDYLSFVTEMDWVDRLEMIYHIYSYNYRKQPLGVILRTDLPREGMPIVQSMTAVWPGAEYMEREAFEMMGIRFAGHPDLRRILLPDDFVGFPMRKDYETDFSYVTAKSLVHELDPTFRTG